MKDNLMTWEQAVTWLISQPYQQELVKFCYYDHPLLEAVERFNNGDEWQAIKQILSPYFPAQVLDIGAGRGISSYAFAKAGCTVTALEPDPSNLVGANAIKSLVKQTNLPIKIVEEYGETLPFDDNSFDIVYGRAVLHHAHNLSKFCQEAARVLKPKGIFLFTREHVISKKEDLQIFLDNHPLHSLYGGENAYLLSEYKQAVINSGLKIKKVIHPYESVINYAPMTQVGFHVQLKSVLSKRLGSKLADKLANFAIINYLYSSYLNQKSNLPGRNFSFLAVKQ